jgi:RNA-binding protein YhbY
MIRVSIKRKLKDKIAAAREEKAIANVGKKGMTPSLVKHIDQQLEKKELVKVKFLSNYFSDNLDLDIKVLTDKTRSKLIEKRGKTIILYRSIPKE